MADERPNLRKLQLLADAAIQRAQVAEVELERVSEARRRENRTLYDLMKAEEAKRHAAEAQVLALRRIAIPNHTGHWDRTGGSGSGCPECQRIRAALADTEAAAKALEQRIEQRGYDRAKAEDRAIIAQGIALSKAQP